MAGSDPIQDPLDDALAGSPDNGRVGAGQWMALAAALLGWMFDGAEMGVFSMVGRTALKDLMPGMPEGDVGFWFGVITALFLVGAATGGVLFGWLGDRIGRVRAMTLSVLVYALFTGLCGVANAAWPVALLRLVGWEHGAEMMSSVGAAWQVGLMRFIAALGMGGEWSLGVALVMEVWPNRSRALMAGLIGAAANVGYLLVGVIGLQLKNFLGEMRTLLVDVGMSHDWVEMLTANQGWRLMMLMGTLPALLTFLIRIFVPESEKWQHEKDKGSTSNWETKDLLGVIVGGLGPILIVYVWSADVGLPARIVGSIAGLVIATCGYTWPVVRFLHRQGGGTQAESREIRQTLKRMLLAACLSGVALLGTWAGTQWIPTWADQLTNSNAALGAKEHTQMWLAFGAIVGTIAAAMLGDWIGRRPAYTVLCVISFFSILGVFQLNHEFGTPLLVWSFISGACTASFYGWLPLYLPELFKTSFRATGQGFSFNFGRILAAVGALQTGTLMGVFKNDIPLAGFTIKGGYPLACSVMSAVYLFGIVIIWFLPETRGKPLPE
ncbi:MAG TPA: MFS transporter [Pirellulales bacterium]